MCPRFRTRFLRNMEPIKRVEQSASRSRTRMIIVKCLNDHLLKSSISSWKAGGKLNWMPSRNKNFCHFMIFCYASIAWQSCLSKRMSKMESSWRSGSVDDFQTTLSYKREGQHNGFSPRGVGKVPISSWVHAWFMGDPSRAFATSLVGPVSQNVSHSFSRWRAGERQTRLIRPSPSARKSRPLLKGKSNHRRIDFWTSCTVLV